MEKNEEFIEPISRNNILKYIKMTSWYVQGIRKEINYSYMLHNRRIIAVSIMGNLKRKEKFSKKIKRILKRQRFGGYTSIGKFVKKWEQYLQDENS